MDEDEMLRLDEITFFQEEFRRYVQDEHVDDPQDLIDNFYPEFEQQQNALERLEVRRRSYEDFNGLLEGDGLHEEGEERSSDDDPGINGIPLNHTGPRSPSHNEIHERVTSCLKSGKNLLIECPTLFKRRFKILTGVLDYWQWKKGPGSSTDPEREAAPDPSIIYLATKNLTERKDLLGEIRERFAHSEHLKNMKITILDHRKNLCINDELNIREAIEVDCQCLSMARNYNLDRYNSSRGIRAELGPICDFYSPHRPRGFLYNFVEDNRNGDVASYTVRDIEDLISNGRRNRQCPYFDTRQIHYEAHLVICPQEFLISPLLREEYNVTLESSIIIFDDGHDIENVCYQEGSITVSIPDLTKFIGIFGELVIANDEGRYRFTPDIASLLQRLPALLERFSEWMENEVDGNPRHDEILEALDREQFDGLPALNHPLQYIRTCPTVVISHPESLDKLRKFLNVLSLALLHTQEYHLKVTRSPDGRGNSITVLQINLGNAGILFAPVESPALSVIIGATCLAPFGSFNSELGVTFHATVKIERDDEDEILSSRYLFAYCGNGPNEITFGLNYATRGDPRTQGEVGESILQICRSVPNGVIVFFHTSTFFKKILQFWRNRPNNSESIWDKLRSIKHIVTELEMTNDETTERLIDRYRMLSRGDPESTQNGALLFACRRGKVFEKLETFRGQQKRAIIHVSIPYAAWYLDQLVLSKRHVFETREGYPEPQENHDWYEGEAFKKLNQSFNHSVQDKDWGIVVVLDNRMHSKIHEFDNLLPAWVKNRFRRLTFPVLIQKINQLVASQEVAEN